MIEFIKSNKLLMVTLLLLAGGVYVYNTTIAPAAGDSLLTSTATDVTTTPASQNLLAVLVGFRTIKLDAAIFSSPAFTSLTDFGVTIPTQQAGRDNPFTSYAGAPAATSSPALAPASLLKLPIGSKK